MFRNLKAAFNTIDRIAKVVVEIVQKNTVQQRLRAN